VGVSSPQSGCVLLLPSPHPPSPSSKGLPSPALWRGWDGCGCGDFGGVWDVGRVGWGVILKRRRKRRSGRI
jgi:hypothetical protein